MPTRVSRLAPSPTGLLHLGNARTFLINWALARNGGWRLIMRVEDLDGPRIQAHAVPQMLGTLAWLGIDFDGSPILQSSGLDPYRQAMVNLAEAGLVYACDLTRTQIEEAAAAPHAGGHELRFPPELRPTPGSDYRFDREDTSYRFVTEDGPVTIRDEVCGVTTHRPLNEVGDFVVWTKRGTPSYQLAVVVDDARQGVTDVVRGDDLLASAARQTLLYEALGLRPPRWWHVPLVLGPDGMRLAKRHGDARIDTYRRAGVSPQRVVGLLARWSGVCAQREEMSVEDFRRAFSLANLPRGPITLMKEDLSWLLG